MRKWHQDLSIEMDSNEKWWLQWPDGHVYAGPFDAELEAYLALEGYKSFDR